MKRIAQVVLIGLGIVCVVFCLVIVLLAAT